MLRIAALALAFAAVATPASASLAFLSRTGSGTSCTLANPCKDMTAAIAAAGAGGNVVCLDRSDYSGSDFVNINTSLKISCGDGLWQGYGTALLINPPANSSVLIEGFVSDGDSTVNSIEFTGQGTLELLRIRVSSSGGGRNGVNFAPTGPATLHVSDSVFYNTAGSGIQVRPTSNGFANVHIRNVKFERGTNGLFVDGSASTIGINVTVSDSKFAENSSNGIGAFTTAGKAAASVTVKDSHITGNIGNGIAALAATASGAGSVLIVVGGSLISGNVTGISASSAGQIRTHGNNQLLLNGNNGTFTGSVALQ